MECDFFLQESGSCEVADQIAGTKCKTNRDICQACVNCSRPRRLNIHTAALAMAYNPKIKESQLLEILAHKSRGFGTKLSEVFDIAFIKKENCKCETYEDILNSWDKETFLSKIDEVTSWLQSEAKRRRLPFYVPFIKLLLKRIANSVN